MNGNEIDRMREQERREEEKLMGEKRYAAARRALGVVNRLSPGPYRLRHVSRIMAAMNVLRGQLSNSYQAIGG